MPSINELNLIGRKIAIAHCLNPEPSDEDGNTLVALNDRVKYQSQYGQIIKVGKDCKFFDQDNVGDYVKLPVYMQADFHVLKKYVDEYKTNINIVDERVVRDGLPPRYEGKKLIRKGNNVGWLTYTIEGELQ